MTDAAEAQDQPLGFHHIRLELAREPGHPQGDAEIGYDILAPLDDERRLNAAIWRAAPERCRVRRFFHGATMTFGRLRHAAPDRWFLDFEPGQADDVRGFRLADERFRVGEYVSLTQGADTQTYVVARAEPV
ncbi:hypothetical protein [Brevundimonas sp.]|jgi:hypothetical protein|uniref:hypothetical protein n=1 Tax=Brevundimonas sp. TaxID=1871086 RepID=UPI000DB1762E|nr:hypothetical protein [Brevundimonas sp.]PZT97236.1 MAG: hypothetical protein DI624_11070 [Brevundimonas sp.]